jgi:osmotically-inducible protein OsmY
MWHRSFIFNAPNQFSSMKNSKKITIISLLLATLFTTSCVETVVVGSVAGAVVVTREKTLRETATDVKIAAQLNAEFLKKGLKKPNSYVELMVNEGRVLLIGEMSDPVQAKTASIIAWKVEGVKEVIDELELVEDRRVNLRTFLSDTYDHIITAEVETRLFFTRNIFSRNYKIATLNNTVYLLGVAQSDEEMRKVFSAVSKIRGVKKVVNHVILVSDARRT